MVKVKKVVRTIFDELRRDFKYSYSDAERLNMKMRDNQTKAREVPKICYIEKKGTSLQKAMALIYMLKQNGVKSYLGIYRDQDTYSFGAGEDYAFVLYKEFPFKWYIASVEEEPQEGINFARIKVKKFKKGKDILWIYDPYSEKFGNLLIFGGFLQKPIRIIQ